MAAKRYLPSTSEMDADTHDSVSALDIEACRRVPALTIAAHPILERVGERARLHGLAAGTPFAVNRLEPDFGQPDGSASGPLADACVSRRPLRFAGAPDGGVALDVTETRSRIRAGGEIVAGARVFSAAEVERGVDLEVGRGVVLLLHSLGPALTRSPRFSMVGESDAIERLCGDVVRVADLEVPVLLRGESGTGKELVARALHGASRRASRPFVSVNMAAIPASTAASELFGHVRGAFTGAVRDHRGYFGEADGGTIFLDEIGDAPPDVQVMLLRVLDAGEAQAVGARSPRPVDVRILAATDRDLEAAIDAGHFRLQLLHRLSGYQMQLAPLRARRDDVPRLFFYFLREGLALMGEADHLVGRPGGRAWLPSGFVARLLRYDWPGNVRQLRNVARQLAIASRGAETARVDDSVLALLPVAAPAAAARQGKRLSPSEIGDEALVAALRAHRWKLAATAKALGIARSSLYLLVDRCPLIRKAGDIPRSELEARHAACGGDVDQLASDLEVSKRGLQLRLKELGIG